MPQPHSPRKAPPRTMLIAAALAVAGLVGFGASLLQRTSTPSPQAGAPSTSSAPVLETIYFDASSAALPAQASDVLARVADTARTGSASIVVAAFHDSADGERGLALASQRAQSVAHGLEANGVARDRLALASPAPGTGEREARRVEIRIE